MKTFNTLRIIPTQDGCIVIQEPRSEVWLTPGVFTYHVNSWELPVKLRDLLDTKPEEDNNATE